MDIPMMMGNKDCTTGVSSLANEEPLGVVKVCINVVQEVIGKDCCNGGDSVVGKRETPLRCSGRWFSRKGVPCT